MKKIRESIKENPKDAILLVLIPVLYFTNNSVIKAHTAGLLHIFFVCYFNDLMAPLFLLSYSNILLWTVNKRCLKLKYIVAFCLTAGFVWEFLAPCFKEGSVTDPLDLLCYVLGGILYWGIMHKEYGS
jgi:hypothetical protein